MRIFTTLLAILAFALHLMLGCCWHHAHGSSEMPGHRHASERHHVHLPFCCHHQHSHDGDHEHDPSGESKSDPSPHVPCSDPQCVFAVSGQVEIPAAHDVALPLTSIDQQPADSLLLAFVHDLAEHEKISPHLRRHLALSRLLN